jgi:hypothetical protein
LAGYRTVMIDRSTAQPRQLARRAEFPFPMKPDA